jgi:hypothetical protein
MKRLLLSTSTLWTIAVLSTATLAAPLKCPEEARGLAGGQVYVNDGSMSRLDEVGALTVKERRTVDFFYVVRSMVNRNGAIVVKSARSGLAQQGDQPNIGRVELSRPDAVKDCRLDQLPFNRSVRSAAYEDYHDRGQSGGSALLADDGAALDAIEKFHTAYPVGSRCFKTSERMSKSGVFDKRNNRSQFSFDPNVVDIGMNTAAYEIAAGVVRTGLSFFIGPAVAAPPRFTERRVEIKRYTTANGFACIPFSISMRGTNQVLRVNDLESWDSVGLSRASEFRFGDPGSPDAPR